MTVAIYEATKFYHAKEQYYATARGHTLLRLTYGRRNGEWGGAIKTATASDFGAAPVYRDRDNLIAVMILSVQNLGGSAQAVSTDRDGKGRCFGEVVLTGARDQLIGALGALAEEMEKHLGKRINRANDCSDLLGLYDDLCYTDGQPVYLSDGVYLTNDGRLI